MSEPVNFVVEHYDNEELAEANEQLAMIVAKLHIENDKLREELEQWHRLTAGIELPEYPITEFKPKDLERENAKLRELVRDVVLLAGCEGCDVTKMQLHVQGGDWRTVWERMTELGVPGTEVDA